MASQKNHGVYLYNGFVGLVGIVVFVFIVSYLGGFYTGLIMWLFPADDFQHLSAMGDPNLIAVQHGIVYRPWISIPLFMFYLFIATNGGAYLMEAATLAAEDHRAVSGDANDSGILAPLAYAAIGLTRMAALYLAITMPLVAILPYGSGFAFLFMALGVVAAVFGVIIPLPFIVLNWRFVIASMAMTKGKLDARKFIRERDRAREERIREANQSSGWKQ
jgi:hypothetical protein